MLRARDRLKEAQFFLDRLAETGGQQPQLRYYFSAAISAARSVTLVLQADLRPIFGDAFNAWWTKARTEIDAGPIDFETLRDARNVLQKEGNKLPLVTLSQTLPSGLLASMTITSEPARGIEGVTDMEFKVRVPELRSLREEAAKHIIAATQAAAASLAESPSASNQHLTYTLDDSKKFFDFGQLVTGLSTHFAALDRLVTEAESRFPIPSIWKRRRSEEEENGYQADQE